MEQEYLDKPREYSVKGIANILERFKSRPMSSTPPIKKRGGLNEITELRYQTAKLLDKPIGQVNGLTKGWSKEELRDTLKICKSFINPPALWYKLYKKNKTIYGRSNKKTLSNNRTERRTTNSEEAGQRTLF